MGLLAHHIELHLFGRELAPETPMEHVLAFGATGLVLFLAGHGAYAVVRDLRRRLSRGTPATP